MADLLHMMLLRCLPWVAFNWADNQLSKASMIPIMIPMFETEKPDPLVDDAYDGGYGSDLA